MKNDPETQGSSLGGLSPGDLSADAIEKMLEGLSPERRQLLEILLEEQGLAIPSRERIIQIEPAPREQQEGDTGVRMPLSFAQERLWFIDQWSPGSPAYNIPTALKITGNLDIPILEASFLEIIQRHEILRTVFKSEGGEPYQWILPSINFTINNVDLRYLLENEREVQVTQQTKSEAGLPFDLGEGPLLRVKLLRLEEEEHLALITIHHIIADGWSVGVIIQELAMLYEAKRNGRKNELPPLQLQYADFAVWQKKWLQGEVKAKQLTYWRDQLRGIAPYLQCRLRSQIDCTGSARKKMRRYS
jgi:hypothetical protein